MESGEVSSPISQPQFRLNSDKGSEDAHPDQSSQPGDNSREEEEEEEDYMTMAIPSPSTSSRRETFAQRHKRQQREAEARAHQPSKAELARREAVAREEALSTALPTESKGFKMMAKLGYKVGGKLGAEGNKNALEVPLGLDVKEGKGGVGLDGEKKRKIREEIEKRGEEVKRAKVEEGDFRERVGREREEKRNEGMWWGAMKILEGLEDQDGVTQSSRNVNVLFRPLVKEREEQDRERRSRYDLLQSLSKDTTYTDPEETEQDKVAFGRNEEDVEDDEEHDDELDEYLALNTKDRLMRLNSYLREKHCYCFWCKSKYENNDMEGCPGIDEDDHD